MKQLFLKLLLIGLFSTKAFAGGGVSGGGNVIHIYKGDLKATYILLDYYDSTKPNGYGFEIDLGPGKTYSDKIEYVLNRLAKVDPYRADLYKKLTKQFFDEAYFNPTQSPRATDSNDLGSGYILPLGYSVERIVIQRSEEEMLLNNNNVKYEIAGAVWNSPEFDEATKAGLILHEVAYREAISRGAKNSMAIRRYVALISSKQVLSANYPLEILSAGLSTWGLTEIKNRSVKYYAEPNEEAPELELFQNSNHSINLERVGGVAGQAQLTISSLSSNFGYKFRINNTNLTCKLIRIGIKQGNIQKLISQSQKILNQGINTENIPENLLISISDCNADINLSNKDFNFITDSLNIKAKLTQSNTSDLQNGIIITSNSFSSYVATGVLNENEVSGKKCQHLDGKTYCLDKEKSHSLSEAIEWSFFKLK